MQEHATALDPTKRVQRAAVEPSRPFRILIRAEKGERGVEKKKSRDALWDCQFGAWIIGCLRRVLTPCYSGLRVSAEHCKMSTDG
ncbi:hypothetical protein IF2G_05913 [Cordyceps javanica]|nr:hypothetical protein IF2G_05913 [Cordyceps javanica]